MLRNPKLRGVALCALAVMLGGAGCCARAQQPESQTALSRESPAAQQGPVAPVPTKAVAVMHPTEGSSVNGVVIFEPTPGGVTVTADFQGLTPGSHGFHIHQLGDCSAPDGASAGGHFNPGNQVHGGPDSAERHEGDLGNVVADESGNAHLELRDPQLALSGSGAIIGRGLIVHASTDDFTTQPTGAAGARVACGVIGVAAE